MVRGLVAGWREGVLAVRGHAAVLLEQPVVTKEMKGEARVRQMALARLVGRARLVDLRCMLHPTAHVQNY